MNPKGQETDGLKVARGGNWEDPVWLCRSACRGGDLYPETRGTGIGFRIVKDE
jgi:formylglycine-generating enzyme required for sulfatase activity